MSTQRKFSQRQRKSPSATSPVPGRPSEPRKGDAQPDSPGFQVKAPSASAKKKPSLHRGSRMSKVAKPPHRQPAASDEHGKSLQTAAAVQEVALGLPGGTRNEHRRSSKSKRTETPWPYPVPAAPAKASLSPQGTRGEAAVHRPKASVTADRMSKCPFKIEGAANPITDIKSPSRHDKAKNRSRRQSHAVEKRVLAISPSQAPSVRSSVQPLAPPRFAPSSKKSSMKHPDVGTRPARRSTFAAKKADFVVPVQNVQAAKSPRKSIMSPPRGSRAGKPSLSSPKYAKGEAPRAVSFPATTSALVRVKPYSDHFLSDLDEPALQPCAGRRGQQPPAADAVDDVLVDLHGLTNALDAPRYDPFRPPSNLEGSVVVSGIGFTTPAVSPPKRKKQKSMSSIPGLVRYTETATNAPKRVLFSDGEQSRALQRIAGMCVFLVALTTALLFGCYMLWTHQNIIPSAPPRTSRRGGDYNNSIQAFPLTFCTEDDAPTTALL